MPCAPPPGRCRPGCRPACDPGPGSPAGRMDSARAGSLVATAPVALANLCCRWLTLPARSGHGASRSAPVAGSRRPPPTTTAPDTPLERIPRSASHSRRRHAACRARWPDSHPHRLGGPAARSRRSDLHRSPGRERRCPGGLPRGRDGRTGPRAAFRVLPEGHRRGRPAARGQREPGDPHRRHRGARHRAGGAVGVGGAAVPDRRAAGGRGGDAAALPLPRPAAHPPGRDHAAAQRGQPRRA